MDFRQLKTFKMVATTLNFHRTAEALHYAQSTVSAQIRGLEECFGVPLFDRLGKRISLTAAGQKLLRYADRLLDLEEETLAEMSEVQEAQAILSLRMPQTLCIHYLPEIIGRFNKKHPMVGFDISTCAFHSLQQELKAGVIDLAFLFAEELYSPDLITETLGEEEIVMVAHKDHPLAAESQIHLNDLRHETILLPKHDCAYKMGLEQALATNKIQPVTIMTFNSVASIKPCIQNNIGVGLLPKQTIRKEIETGRLVVLPNFLYKPNVGIFMLRHRNKWLSPILKEFINETKAVFKKKVLTPIV